MRTCRYNRPLVSCVGFSLDAVGRFSSSHVDFFHNPAWDLVQHRSQEEALGMRSQAWSGAAVLPYGELKYSGFRKTVNNLVDRFAFKNGTEEGLPAEQAPAD